MNARISKTFAQLKEKNRAAFIPFVMGGDPDYESSLEILYKLSAAGADLIELGMPFSDPMADGPAVQASGQRALKSGQTLVKTLRLASSFREKNKTVPLVLMGYFNPIYHYGVDKFVHDAAKAGVDGLIAVDCPAEVDEELCLPAKAAGLDFIRLITPTTDEQRLKFLLKNASGFLYLVSVSGVTGTKLAEPETVSTMLKTIKKHTNLPIAAGFGVKTMDQAAKLAKAADGIVIASVLIDLFRQKTNGSGILERNMADYLTLSREFASAIHGAREV
jgi:tryptophan synthase alpha chain